jgi:GntR family transcriptional regulator
MAAEVDQWSTHIAEMGREPELEIEVSIVLPPPSVATHLKVDPDQAVVVRRRLRLVDGVPYQIADSYFPEPLVRGTPLMQPRDVAAPGGVLAYIGRPQARFRDEIRVRMPSKAEADRLDLPPGTPVAEHTRIGYADDGQPLRVMITIAPGDRNVMVYEVDPE